MLKCGLRAVTVRNNIAGNLNEVNIESKKQMMSVVNYVMKYLANITNADDNWLTNLTKRLK